MHHLRSAHLLARLVLVWFMLAMGVATASPLVKPQVMELVCSGAGLTLLPIQTSDGLQDSGPHTLDCPLCSAVGAPPVQARSEAAPVPPLAYVLRSIPSAQVAALTAAPLPARGPPVLICS